MHKIKDLQTVSFWQGVHKRFNHLQRKDVGVCLIKTLKVL